MAVDPVRIGLTHQPHTRERRRVTDGAATLANTAQTTAIQTAADARPATPENPALDLLA